MYFLYSVMTATGLILLAPYFLARGLRRDKNLRNLLERLGLRFPLELAGVKSRADGTIWLHAVSVGEVLAAVPLARSLKERYPERRLVVSTTTETGQALARERINFAGAIFYFPLDLPGATRRAMRAVRPALIVVMETEIWPNFLRAAREFGAPVAYVNGRISDQSFRGFRHWSVPGFRRRVFADGGLYLMQSEEDARRVVELGAPRESVRVTGNLKYDLKPAGGDALASWLETELRRAECGPVMIAGSVLAGEETAVLEAASLVAGKWPRALLVLAPRRPERFAEAAEIVERAGWRVVRRSALSLNGGSGASVLSEGPGGRRPVLLLDSLGELATLYRLADCVFIGGSLVPAGGHNPLEPAAFGKTPVFGPRMESFRDIAGEFLGSGAAVQAGSGAELGAVWIEQLKDDRRRAETGQRARGLVERHRGATAATLQELSALLEARRAAL